MSLTQSERMKLNWIKRKENGYVQWNKGKKGLQKCSEATRLKMSLSHKGKNTWSKGSKQKPETIQKRILHHSGEKHWRWIKDRSLVLKQDRKDSIEYKKWRINVYKRDNWICRLKDNNCNGRIEAHHILSWREFENERYNIDNGITLCFKHHPRKQVEEKSMVPIFQKLVLQIL